MHFAEGDEHSFALSVLSAMIEHFGVESVLDVGSGTGRALRLLKPRHPGVRFLGLEPVPERRQIGLRSGLSEDELVDGDVMRPGRPSTISRRAAGATVSEGDGLCYSYSVFTGLPQIRKACSAVYVLPTVGAGANLYRTAPHVAVLGLKAPQGSSYPLPGFGRLAPGVNPVARPTGGSAPRPVADTGTRRRGPHGSRP